MKIVLCGFMGCGKTTVGKALAKKLKYSFIDTDCLIEKSAGKKINQIFSDDGESHFRALEHEVCCSLANEQNAIVSTGGGALCFDCNVPPLKQNGLIIYLAAPFDVLQSRVGTAENRPLFSNMAKARALYDKRSPLYAAVADHTVNANAPVSKIVDEIEKLLMR